MVNKIGFLNGIFLFFLDFFAAIPLGIYLSGGISSYTEIPIYLINYNDVQIYIWGIINTGVPSWWLEAGVHGGFINFILLQIFFVCACILTFLGSLMNSNTGTKMLWVSLVMILISIIFLLIDLLVVGTTLMGSVISIDLFFGSFGMGFYLLLIILVIEIIAIKIHLNI
ncbi:MAG: hypothetical protein ACTSWY_07985 [Promethearchaeota archaeon]